MSSSTCRLVVRSCLVGCALVGCALVGTALDAHAQVVIEAQPATAPHAAAATSSAAATPAAAAATPTLTYPQVNMTSFSREYRAIPVDATQADEKIRAALRGPFTREVVFQETPLRTVLREVADGTGLPIIVDVQALADAGIDLDATTVTQEQEVSDVSVTAALKLLLRDAGLTWIVRGEVLTVTTREEAGENLVVVAYPLPRGFGDNQMVDSQTMIDLIQSTVAPDTWDGVGGPGAIRPLVSAGDPLLVVSQTSEVHDEVENLLRRIHGRLLAEFAGERTVLRVHHVADARARESLQEVLVDLCNTSLGDLGDRAAAVTIVGDSLSVTSTSPEFHALAAQTIAAVAGVHHHPDHPDVPRANMCGPGMTVGR